jgi:hypothetical protein
MAVGYSLGSFIDLVARGGDAAHEARFGFPNERKSGEGHFAPRMTLSPV